MHLCSEQCTTIREKWPGPVRRSARGTRWPRSRRSAWGTRRLTPARGKGRRGRSTAVIGVMTRKITIVITNLEFNRETEQRRLHVKTLFENIAFLSLQGLVKKEPKQNMSSSSEVNRGNFIGIELLSLRAKDVPVVKMKIETPVNNFGGGGSGYGAVQNEMIKMFGDNCS